MECFSLSCESTAQNHGDPLCFSLCLLFSWSQRKTCIVGQRDRCHHFGVRQVRSQAGTWVKDMWKPMAMELLKLQTSERCAGPGHGWSMALTCSSEGLRGEPASLIGHWVAHVCGTDPERLNRHWNHSSQKADRRVWSGLRKRFS